MNTHFIRSANPIAASGYTNKASSRRLIPSLAVAGTLFICPAVLHAQELSLPCDEKEAQVLAEKRDNEVKRITAFQPAKPKRRVDPQYPISAARQGKEGWVKMSFIIDEEGNVNDPVVNDFGGHKDFKFKALRAIKRWKFEPAMKDGKPTQQCEHAVQFDFILGGKSGASREFIKAYQEVDTLFKAGNVADADALLMDLRNESALNHYENAWAANMDANIASDLKDWRRELSSLKRVKASNGSTFGKNSVFSEDHIAYTLQRSVILAAELGYYADAVDAFEELQSFEEQQEKIQAVQPIIETIEEQIASNKHIRIDMEIDDRELLFHTLVRNQFAFDSIKGDLGSVEVRCQSHREKFTVAEDHIWTIPESWGECRVMVKGAEGTSFELIEVGSTEVASLN
ncbi:MULTISPECIES: energy transducer TonB [unclassified Alteromonas]|uniref:energy transducer TonB n=1 Tax=unclassified Alteromonas TaxID=2614992 RepID=UPI0006923517|nr:MULTISPECIES: energy transducer TonB [unclassified Alteromonas]